MVTVPVAGSTVAQVGSSPTGAYVAPGSAGPATVREAPSATTATGSWRTVGVADTVYSTGISSVEPSGYVTTTVIE